LAPGWRLLGAALLVAPHAGLAQTAVPPAAPVTATPLAPVPASPPGAPAPPTGLPPANQPPAAAPDLWLPRTVADVQALDKVSAQVQTLSLRLGQPAHFGSLVLTLRACMVRPPDQPQDSAAYLEITDSQAQEPGFRGWMFASEPEVSMLESPIYDVRLNACHS
jgi:hypothetical protein